MDKDLKESKLFTPYKLGPVTLRNRTIRSAAFESMGKDFGPTQKLKDYHVSVARGGIGMTTLAYASINRSGVSFNSQLWLRPEIVPALRDITDAIHAEGAAAGIQIGHCGNMTHWSTAGCFPVSASNGFNLYSPTFHRRLRRDEIVEMARDFGRAVETAHEAGFDSVEVHAGHGYLISQFLSPYTNHRRDEFGGSLANRMRFMDMCLEEVMQAAARCRMAVLVKHNMEDGFRGGIEIPESIEIAKRIENMSVKEAREFEEGLREQAQKVYDGMKVKDFRAYKHEVHKEMERFCRENKEQCKLLHPPRHYKIHSEHDEGARAPKPKK